MPAEELAIFSLRHTFATAISVMSSVQNIDSGNIVKNAYARYNLSIGVGLAKVQGKV